jgi:act minimal PKS ketosynthase (KS/KS alpha)
MSLRGYGRSPIAITGIGVVAPGGIGLKAFWELLTAGRSAIREISLFDATGFRSRIAAECDFDPRSEGLSPREARRMDRAAQFAVVGARDALDDSGVDLAAVPPERIGVSIGSAVGCTMRLEEEYVVLSDGGREWLVDPSYVVSRLPLHGAQHHRLRDGAGVRRRGTGRADLDRVYRRP